MSGPKNNSNQLFWMLGLALTLPMLLLSGPLAGYFIGYALVNRLHKPGFWLPVLMTLGLLGSVWQTVLLIRRLLKSLNQSANQNKKN